MSEKKELSPADIAAMRTQIKDDLESIAKKFNEWLEAWEQRTGCTALFSTTYDRETGKPRLKIREIVMPIQAGMPTEDEVKAAEEILSQARTVSVQE